MLKTRVITAVVSLLVLGTVLFVIPAEFAKAVIALLILAGAWEWAGFLNMQSTFSRMFYVSIIAVLMLLFVFVIPGQSTLVLQFACLWWLIAFTWIFFFPTPIPVAVRWICGALVLVPMFIALSILYDRSPQVLLFALLIVWAADMGAYFAGKKFGRVKLAPQISPGKTWEGVIGGLFVVFLLAATWAYFQSLPYSSWLPFCLAVGAISVVGDLTVSMFKRTAGVKDSGKLFPGHGGVLDRVDSVSAASPVFALGLNWIGFAV